ncbi:MAG: N-acetylglucosamine-specific PTS transporter subunit IIBC [Actinomycetaceae bacterium]|nr:N-acetylglucosamine-specific PTS transporter subunit IIBC [Actinomycetaceae bacterium]MDY5855377.1 N-acetylglucosamine-specific PTS transporter subunit IIBC [Arcanobacterium sp.]
MNGKVFGGLQRLGKALMGAVAVMPVAAILMGIGYWIDPVGWGADNVIALVLIKAGGVILDNLGWLFAVAVAFGLAKQSNGAAALSGWIGYGTVKMLLMPGSIEVIKGLEKDADGAWIYPENWASQGWAAINDKNVLIGILVGVLAAWTYNRFHTTKLPDFLAFFSGRRLVPILTSFFAIILAAIMFFVWPFLYSILFAFGNWIVGLGAVGAGIYGVINRLLIPTGLHHAVNQIFWFDVVGINDLNNFLNGGKTINAAALATSATECSAAGVTLDDGTLYHLGSAVWNSATNTCEVIGNVGMYQGGFFPIMMFGLPGAALAMYLTAKTSKKKVAGALMFAGALASFFTGVTEPLEFSFMFLAPALYLVHAILTGISVAIAAAFHWTAGFGFSAGLVDMVLSAQNPIANKWYMLLLMGVVYFFVYFVIFYFLIKKFDIKTPGREDDVADADEALAVNASDAEKAQAIIKGLGGAGNISVLDYCATRLRVTVKDDAAVSENAIKAAGVAGLIRPTGNNVQVVIGPQVQFVYDAAAAELSQADVLLNGEQAA